MKKKKIDKINAMYIKSLDPFLDLRPLKKKRGKKFKQVMIKKPNK